MFTRLTILLFVFFAIAALVRDAKTGLRRMAGPIPAEAAAPAPSVAVSLDAGGGPKNPQP